MTGEAQPWGQDSSLTSFSCSATRHSAYQLPLRCTNNSPTEKGQETLGAWLGSIFIWKANRDSVLRVLQRERDGGSGKTSSCCLQLNLRPAVTLTKPDLCSREFNGKGLVPSAGAKEVREGKERVNPTEA